MSKGLSIKDVKQLLEEMQYKIEKDPAWTCRRYLLTAPKGEIIPIRYTPTMAEMYHDIKKKGIDKFIAEHDASDNVAPNQPRVKTSKAAKPAKAKKMAKSPAVDKILKAKEKLTVPVEKNNQEVQQAQVVMASNYNAPVVELDDYRELDYSVKIPNVFQDFYFPNFATNVVNRIALRRNCFFTGPAGCGKSEFVAKLAEFMGVKLVRINFNIGTTEQHLIGKFIVKDGRTEFIYGLIPLAMKNGWWVLLDEIDYAQPEHLSVLQSVLEGNNLLISQNQNEEIVPHKNFRLFATGNTKGRGDETQSFTGTNFLNSAFLDRWSIFEMNYTNAENKICNIYLSQDKVLIEQLVQYIKLLRKSMINGELNNASFSTRRLIQICEALAIGESLKDALTYELWSRYDEYEVTIMQELAYDIWERDFYFKGHWIVGNEHAPEKLTTNHNTVTKTAEVEDED